MRSKMAKVADVSGFMIPPELRAQRKACDKHHRGVGFFKKKNLNQTNSNARSSVSRQCDVRTVKGLDLANLMTENSCERQSCLPTCPASLQFSSQRAADAPWMNWDNKPRPADHAGLQGGRGWQHRVK